MRVNEILKVLCTREPPRTPFHMRPWLAGLGISIFEPFQGAVNVQVEGEPAEEASSRPSPLKVWSQAAAFLLSQNLHFGKLPRSGEKPRVQHCEQRQPGVFCQEQSSGGASPPGRSDNLNHRLCEFLSWLALETLVHCRDNCTDIRKFKDLPPSE